MKDNIESRLAIAEQRAAVYAAAYSNLQNLYNKLVRAYTDRFGEVISDLKETMGPDTPRREVDPFILMKMA